MILPLLERVGGIGFGEKKKVHRGGWEKREGVVQGERGGGVIDPRQRQGEKWDPTDSASGKETKGDALQDGVRNGEDRLASVEGKKKKLRLGKKGGGDCSQPVLTRKETCASGRKAREVSGRARVEKGRGGKKLPGKTGEIDFRADRRGGGTGRSVAEGLMRSHQLKSRGGRSMVRSIFCRPGGEGKRKNSLQTFLLSYFTKGAHLHRKEYKGKGGAPSPTRGGVCTSSKGGKKSGPSVGGGGLHWCHKKKRPCCARKEVRSRGRGRNCFPA